MLIVYHYTLSMYCSFPIPIYLLKMHILSWEQQVKKKYFIEKKKKKKGIKDY